MEVTAPKYSVCITNYNKGRRVRSSLESLLPEVDRRFEVVVTDNMSNDGSQDTLREYARDGAIRLFQAKCSRGLGREIAFERANGQYIISGVDTDDVLIQGRLRMLLDFYHKKCEGKLIRVMESGIVVGPAQLIRLVGGWRDLQFGENWDIAERAARIDRYAWTIFRVKKVIQAPSSVSLVKQHRLRYKKFLDWLRLGRRPFAVGEKIGYQKRVDYILARAMLIFRGRLNMSPPDFADDSPAFYIDSSDWWHMVGQNEDEETKWYLRRFKMLPECGSRGSTVGE